MAGSHSKTSRAKSAHVEVLGGGSAWENLIRNEIETEIGIPVAEIPHDAMTTERYMELTTLSYAQAAKRLRDMVSSGQATKKLFKVTGKRQSLWGYFLK